MANKRLKSGIIFSLIAIFLGTFIYSRANDSKIIKNNNDTSIMTKKDESIKSTVHLDNDTIINVYNNSFEVKRNKDKKTINVFKDSNIKLDAFSIVSDRYNIIVCIKENKLIENMKSITVTFPNGKSITKNDIKGDTIIPVISETAEKNIDIYTGDFTVNINDKDGVAIGTYDGVIGKDNIISFKNQ